MNGEIIHVEDAQISPADRGLLLGDGIFETLRAYGGRIFRLDAHLDRLIASANLLQIPIPILRVALSQALTDTLEANQLSKSDAALRLTLTRGIGPRGLSLPPNPRPTLIITAILLDKPHLPPAKALITSIRRNQYSPLCKIKSLNFLDNILARQEATAKGFDEALLLNCTGQLVEASAANLFIVSQSSLLTPPINDGALPGVTRGVIIELAKSHAIPIREISLDHKDVASVDEAFLTNSLIEIQPLIQVGDQIIGQGEIGSITAQLQYAFRQLTSQY
ncbi:MAG: aminotransferase class IV [Chloroflexi bacterium]|nr:aminotransferase class IV [Chloroflexota bacterium]